MHTTKTKFDLTSTAGHTGNLPGKWSAMSSGSVLESVQNPQTIYCERFAIEDRLQNAFWEGF